MAGEAPNVVVKDGSLEGVNVFGKVDVNKHGNISSEMPAWYFRAHKDEISENIRTTEAALERGEIAENNKPQIVADLKKMRAKLDTINESEPRFSGNQQDSMAKMAKGLGKKIAESMFTRTDMQRGTADAHEEARRMVEPCIKLDSDELILAKKIGAKVWDGKVSRNDAERVWKIAQRALGENSNSEILRRG